MKTEQFKKWLVGKGEHKQHVIESRISNCRKVEKYYNDLDLQFKKDEGNSLKLILSYSTEDKRNNAETKHNIPIVGNLLTGSAALKQAVNLYMKFCISLRD